MTPQRLLKQGVLSFIILATFVVAVVPVSPEKPFTKAVAHAQETPASEDPNAVGEVTVDAAPTPTPPSSQDKPGVLTQALDAAKKAGAFVFDTGVDALLIVVLGIASIFLNLASLWTYLGGTLLNGAIFLTVVHMGTIVNEIPAITIAWEVVRDLANILIIFVMVWISIATILRIEQYGAKKLLASVIIAAVLLNFSLFITKTIIDVSNRFSVEIVSAMGLKCTDFENGECWNTGVSARFASVMKLTTAADIDVANLDRGKMVLATIMGIIVLLVAGYIFFAAAVLLVTRFVVLIILMVLSPIGFVGTLLPRLKKSADKWWETLINQSLFAPFYLLLLYISLIIVESPGFQRVLGGGDFGKALSESTLGSFSAPAVVVIINYMVVIGFLAAALMMAKSLGAYGADTMLKWGKSLAGRAAATPLRFGLGGLSWLGKRYYDRFQAGVEGTQKPTLKFWKGDFWKGANFAGMAARGARGAATLGSFGVLGDKNIRDTLKAGQETKFFGQQSFDERRKEKEARDVELADVRDYWSGRRGVLREGGLKDQHNEARAQNDAHVAEGMGTTMDDINAFGHAKLGDKWDQMSDAEKVKWFQDNWQKEGWKGRLLKLDENGGLAMEDEWELKDRVRRKAKIKVKNEKGEMVDVTYEDTVSNLKSALIDMPAGALKLMYEESPELLVDMTGAFTSEQYIEIMKDKTISRAIKDRVREARHGDLLKEVNEFEKRVIDEDKWERMSDEERAQALNDGKVVRGSREYDEKRRYLHEEMKKNRNRDEMADLVTSNPGKAAGLLSDRGENKSTIFWDATTDGFYMEMQKNPRIAAGVKRRIRGMKRSRLENALKMDEEADEEFDALGINTETERDATAAEVSALSDEDYRARLGTVGEDSKEGRRLKAGRKRAKAEKAANGWFAGKQDEEVQNELKQESLGKRLVGKLMRRGQARTVNKDQVYMDQHRDSMLVHGDDDTVNWLVHNQDGQTKYGTPSEAQQKRINAEREKLGKPLIDFSTAYKDSGTVGKRKEDKPVDTPRSRASSAIRGRRDDGDGRPSGGGGAPAERSAATPIPSSPDTEARESESAAEEPARVRNAGPIVREEMSSMDPDEATAFVRDDLDENALRDPEIGASLAETVTGRQLSALFDTRSRIPDRKLSIVMDNLIKANKARRLDPRAQRWLETEGLDHMTPAQRDEYEKR